MWVLAIEAKSSSLVDNTFTHQAVLLALPYLSEIGCLTDLKLMDGVG